MIPAVAYLRVSTREQAESGDSIPAQRERLRRWAREHGYRIVREYVDAGESARVSDRPAFSRLVQDARRSDRDFDAVLVWKWDRFARNAEDAALYKAILRRECGVQVISIGDPPGEGAVGQLMERILDVVAEFQSLVTAEHVTNTMAYLAQQGRWLSKPPYGYRIGEDGRLVIDEEEAAVVRWMFEEAARGRGLISLTDGLLGGEAGEAALRRRWSPQLVRQTLRNPVYYGVARWRVRRYDVTPTQHGSARRARYRPPQDWIEVPHAHPPIVSKAVWEEAQRQLELRGRQRTPRPQHALHGLVRCGRCERPMYRLVRPDRSPRWMCSGATRPRTRGRCEPAVTILHRDLIEAVAAQITETIEGAQLRPEDLVFEPPNTDAIQRRLQIIAQTKERLLKAYLSGVLELEVFAREKQKLDAEEQELRTPPATPDVETVREKLRHVGAAVLEALESEDTERARAILSRVIHSIVVEPDRTVRVRYRLVSEA